MLQKWEEAYELQTRDFNALMMEVDDMVAHTSWHHDLDSKALKLMAIEDPMSVQTISTACKLDYDQTYANFQDGSKLIVEYDSEQFANISNLAKGTLCETAKLSGSSLGRMTGEKLSQTLNNGLEVAKGKTLLLLRYGSAMAFHSDGSYAIMPMNDLLNITVDNLKMKFGDVQFQSASHANAYTSAIFTLPDARERIMKLYSRALSDAVSNKHPIDFMPAARFSSSDTAHAAAVLKPMFFMKDGTAFSMGDGIAVKHENKARRSRNGVDAYREDTLELYAKFEETIENVKRLAQIEIEHPVNCYVGICNWLNRSQQMLPRKYADDGLEKVEYYEFNSPVISAHDLYLALVSCIHEAKEANASRGTLFFIEEAIAKVVSPSFDWKRFDVGGVVAWGEKGKW